MLAVTSEIVTTIGGNYACDSRIRALKIIIETLGIEEGRFYLDWISASEGEKFANTMKMVSEQVKELGPFSWRKATAEVR